MDKDSKERKVKLRFRRRDERRRAWSREMIAEWMLRVERERLQAIHEASLENPGEWM